MEAIPHDQLLKLYHGRGIYELDLERANHLYSNCCDCQAKSFSSAFVFVSIYCFALVGWWDLSTKEGGFVLPDVIVDQPVRVVIE